MEYTYKNTVSAKAYSITVSYDHLTIVSINEEQVIKYPEIAAVQLSRSGKSVYRMTLYIHNSQRIEITNQYHLASGEVEDRSKQYASFVRLLHRHLQEKSNPEYKSGVRTNLLFICVSLAAFAACFVTFIGEFFSFSLAHPFMQVAVLTAVIAASILVFNRKRIVQQYSPDNLPLHFLP